MICWNFDQLAIFCFTINVLLLFADRLERRLFSCGAELFRDLLLLLNSSDYNNAYSYITLRKNI